MMFSIANFFGWVSVVFFALTVSNFFAKKIVEKFEIDLKKTKIGNYVYIFLFKYIMRFGHKNWDI